MLIYRPKKKFDFKKTDQEEDSSLQKNKDRIKQRNIDMDVTQTSSVSQLQNALGNKGAMIMLKELGKVGLDPQEMKNTGEFRGELFQRLEDDEKTPAMELNKEVEEFKSLVMEDNHAAYDAVHSGRFATTYQKKNQPELNKTAFMDDFRGFLQLVNVLKVYINQDEAKEIEVEEGDQLLKDEDEKLRHEVDMLITMIGRLPDYNPANTEIMEKYFKVYKFVIASGVDLKTLFQNNGSLRKQRELMVDSIDQGD